VTEGRCLTASELAEVVRGGIADDTAEHLKRCETCRRRIAILRRIDVVGVDDVAAVVDDTEGPITRLLALPRPQWWRAVCEPEYRQPEIVRRLLVLADDASGRDRKMAVALITAATRIADSLAVESQEIKDLRFEAWKLASALFREAGKYGETEKALARAELIAPVTSDPRSAEATILYYRALLFAEPDVWRPEEASNLLDQIDAVFAGNPGRRHALQTARAVLSARCGDFSAAVAALEALLAETPPTAREAWLDALKNLMVARVGRGDATDDVVRQLGLVIDENVLRGRAVQAARARWQMGKVRQRRGEYDESIEMFEAAMRDIGDTDSAIRIGLDSVETLLLQYRYDTALSLARDLANQAVALDTREPSRRRSLTAEVFAYARDAAERGALTADLVSELGRYLDRIYRQRPTSFVPPMPLSEM
jgi:tetratricopeptide (TPR) repeat protein